MKVERPARAPRIRLTQLIVPVQASEGSPVSATMQVAFDGESYPPYDYAWRTDLAPKLAPEHGSQYTLSATPAPGGVPGGVETLTTAYVTVIDMFGQMAQASAPVRYRRAQRRSALRRVVTAAIIAAALLFVASGALVARGYFTQQSGGGQTPATATATDTPNPTATPTPTTITVTIVSPKTDARYFEGNSVQLVGQAVNPATGQALPDGDFSWTLTPIPATVGAGTPTATAGTPTHIAQGATTTFDTSSLAPGDYTLELDVSDTSLNLTGSTSVTITIQSPIQ